MARKVKERVDESFYLYRPTDGAITSKEGDITGRIANALSKNISYERESELFDGEEIEKRDKELRKLKSTDIELCIDRKDKPVVLTSYQSRIIHALSYFISLEIGKSEDVKAKILRPNKGDVTIKRVVNITALSSLIFNSTRKRYKDIIIKELYNLGRIRQIQRFSLNEGGETREIKITAPLILIGHTMEDLSPEKEANLDAMEIIFGSSFFYALDKRFAVITPQLFRVWEKGGRGTELFSVLLSKLFSVYWSCLQAANLAEKRVRSDSQGLTREQLHDLIAEERRKAMTFELNVENIKRAVTTDYDSKRSYKARFAKDLENAIEGYKELNLVTDYKVVKGVKGQDKVVFILSEDYNLLRKQNEPNLLPFKDEKEAEEEAAF